jgi:TolB-like protein/DNA-binding winged helix-turn-helix (wHTH) protein/tetratricopeptide (TPR) repeat protein
MKNRIYKFGEFELSLPDGDLRSGNVTVRLQDKPLLLLSELLDHPQRLVTRQQLRERMWDKRTVVNFEQGINVAIKKVRDALGDSSETPCFIETVARKGYRFLASVEVVADPSKEVNATKPPPVDAGIPPIAADVLEANPRINSGVGRWLLVSAAATAILCTFGFGLYGIQTKTPRALPIRSLAVLPLQNLSPDVVGQEYFVDGITDEIITNLAQTLPLRVISRSSVMRFKRTDKSVAEIANALGVEAIVEGSVARSGDHVSITVQLIDANQDRHLWAHTYERRLDDILTTESEVSSAIAIRISGTLASQQTRPRDSRPVDPQVYDLCLMGKYHFNKRATPDLVKAEDYYQRALAIDPAYAPAFVGLAKVYSLMPQVGAAPLISSLAKSTAAARRALDLDDGSAEAHATLGMIAVNTDPDWKTSDVEFRRALELDPNDVTAHQGLAFFLLFAGRGEEAVAEIRLARQLDPLSAGISSSEGHILYATRHFDEARASLRRSIELAPESGRPYATLALLELESGNPAEALKEARVGLELNVDDPAIMGEAGYVLARTGQAPEARMLLATLKDPNRRGGLSATFAAMIEVGLGERDRALATIKEEMRIKGFGTHGLGQYHVFDDLKLSSEPAEQHATL